MAWTDERVEELKKLWSEGLSASQIAKQLGGVTRNAVIGKVHRLGLSGRATPSRPARRATKPSRPRTTTASTAPAARTVARPSPSAPPAATPAPVEPAVLPSGEFATVLTLRESMCKWPIGDPSQSEFRFCGRKADTGQAYCNAHSDMAYQPSQKRRRRTSDANAALDAIAATRRFNF
ncbi:MULTISPECIES: GcrA family cell cycle regulator [Maricaulis]|jgi:GcrA cell cycle regulator|uniref:Global cell cycle regulator GcrA n=1 Tax=Maricaulis maris (strain MCS10) TaxID=394221 RepID=Q0ASF9_MARMM|nr:MULTISPECIES: GcrA family cell cycle regulator [Maricaulis]ABI64778.1 Global cell cycle regulator GcrA [Maricaulis maris MCS10]MAC88247.1 GcrA cell cycle regulator [Maricaulis sp.]